MAKCPQAGCLNCPLPECVYDKPLTNPKGNVKEQNRRYKEKHREELRKKNRERYRKMKAALAYCEAMGIEV